MPLHVYLNRCRKKSTTANVDSSAIAKRKCFLCADNQPHEQQSIFHLIRGTKYRFQVNPYPITPYHFTIADAAHKPQRIAGRIADMWDINRNLKDYAILYNGPRCGASAPDHFHFQAAPAGFIPLCATIEKADIAINDIYEGAEGKISISKDLWWPHFIISSYSSEGAMTLCEKVLSLLPKENEDDEPKVNIVVFNNNTAVGSTLITIIPRSKHRPTNYGTGDGKCLFSPGAFDMAGVITLIEEDDYKKLDYEAIAAMLDEVSIDRSTYQSILDSTTE